MVHLEHEGEKDVVLALAFLQGGEVSGQQRVRVDPRHLHVPLVQRVVHQLNLQLVLKKLEQDSERKCQQYFCLRN